MEMDDGSAGFCRADRRFGDFLACDRQGCRHRWRVDRTGNGACDDDFAAQWRLPLSFCRSCIKTASGDRVRTLLQPQPREMDADRYRRIAAQIRRFACKRRLFPRSRDGAVAVDAGRIVAVGERSDIEGGFYLGAKMQREGAHVDDEIGAHADRFQCACGQGCARGKGRQARFGPKFSTSPHRRSRVNGVPGRSATRAQNSPRFRRQASN
jgi:hypothetical protein